MIDSPINVDPPRNPATGLIAGLLQGIGAEVSRIRQLLFDDRIQKTMHRTPMRTHLELHAEKWCVFPAALTNFGLVVGTKTVAVVRASAGAVVVDLPITIAGGQDIFVIDTATGTRVDGNLAVLLDSYLIGSIGGSKA